MLKVIRRYHKGVMGLFAILCIAVAMSGFGVQFMHTQSERHALKINDTEISYQQYEQERRDLEKRYRQMLRGNFEQFAKSLNLNLNQEVLDKLTNEILIGGEAKRQGLAVGEAELRKLISSLFPDPDGQGYLRYLQDSGTTGPAFEHKLRGDLLREQYMSLLNDVSTASSQEIRRSVEEAETTRNVEYVTFTPEKYESEVPTPSDAELETYYKTNATDYELPARVSYDYVIFSPKDFLSSVEVRPEDIELYYADNQSKFATPEESHVRHVQLLFPKEPDPAKMSELQKKAEEVHGKAQAGESFESLVMQYSDDIPSKVNGGDLGWVTRGKYTKEFDAAVFKLKGPGIAELISTDTGYQIVKVEEFKASGVKELKDVKSEIETELKQQDAPAYASSKAEEISQEWQKSGKPLSEIVKAPLTVKSTEGLIGANQDPEPGLKGLTEHVIPAASDKQQLVEMDDKTVLVSVKEFKDVEIPPLAEIKDKVLAAYKRKEAAALAEKKAQEFLQMASSGEKPDFSAAAKKADLKITEEPGIGKKKSGADFLAKPDVQQAVSDTNKENTILHTVYKDKGNFYIAHVKEILRPDAKTIEEKIANMRDQESATIGRTLLASIANQLKVKYPPEFDQSLLLRE